MTDFKNYNRASEIFKEMVS